MKEELTIADVYNICEKEMLKGNGNRILLVTDDEEGNGYHALWYGIEAKNADIRRLIEYGIIKHYDADKVAIIG